MSTITSPALTRDNFTEFNASRIRDWAEANPRPLADFGHSDDSDIPRERSADNDRLWLERLANHGGCFHALADAYNDAMATGLAAAPDFEPDPTQELRERITYLEGQLASLQGRTYSQYDDVMRPMFVNAARIAQSADFCGEYDRIAEAVGGPTREELRASGDLNETHDFYIPISVTMSVRLNLTSRWGTDDDIDEGDFIEEFDDDIRQAIQDGNFDLEYVNPHPNESIRID